MQEETKKQNSDAKQVSRREAQPPCGYPPGYAPGAHMEEDEINLLDLFIVLLKHKVMIFSVVFLTGIFAVIYSLTLPNVYRSEATIAPTTQEKGASAALSALGGFGAMIASDMGIGATGSLEQFEVVLKSRELTQNIVREHNLLPVLFETSWNDANKRWKVAEPSVLQKIKDRLIVLFGAKTGVAEKKKEPFAPEDIYQAVHSSLKVSPDKKKNVMTVSFEMKDPQKAQAILNYFILGLSEFLRARTLEDAAAQEEQLSRQLAKTTDPLLKNRLYELIARQIENDTLARVQKYYSFNVIDPPALPEKKAGPKRAQICILSVVVAFFIAVFLAFFLEYVHNLKKREDPERLANLRNALRFRRK